MAHGHRANVKRAIRNALASLGMQSRPAQIVAFLAGRGIQVSEESVRGVLLALQRQTGRADMHRARARQPVLPMPRRPQRIPSRRDGRR
jgi:hypothetical protein